jgi:hypothetical protein
MYQFAKLLHIFEQFIIYTLLGQATPASQLVLNVRHKWIHRETIFGNKPFCSTAVTHLVMWFK